MRRQILLLRGINLAPARRIPMAGLRSALTAEGFQAVRTYLQSGNVVLESEAPPIDLAASCSRVIAKHFGFEVPVIARSAGELERVLDANPLRDLAVDPKRYLVTFLEAELEASLAAALSGLAAPEERVVVGGREIYSWYPEGVARSKLWSRLAGRGLGVTASSRNWATVGALAEMARG